MSEPIESYPKAIVPEHLTRLIIEKLPVDTPYYPLTPEEDEYGIEPVSFFVDDDGALRMNAQYTIDSESDEPDSIIGRVGIMRTFVVDSRTGQPRVAFVADLRFAGDHQLPVHSTSDGDILDQEDYMYRLAQLENSIRFDAFVTDTDDDGGDPRAAYYGDAALYDALSFLVDETDTRARSQPEDAEKDPTKDHADRPVRLREKLFNTLKKLTKIGSNPKKS